MTKAQVALLVAGVLVLAAALVIRAKQISPISWGWFGAVESTNGVAIGGYDPVSYFSDSPLKGSPTHAFEWRGATWHFADSVNRAAFIAEPERFAPQFGGYCAYAASKGFTATCDPTAYQVDQGKLYLFNDAAMRDKWRAELPDGVIERAARHWEKRP